MNHPSNEQWMSYCYEELPKQERAELEAHLKTCAACADKVHGWDFVRAEMNAFKVARGKSPRPAYAVAPMVLKWAAAVAVVCAAIALGRFSSARQYSSSLDPGLEAALEQRLRSELSQMVQIEVSSAQNRTKAASEERTKELLKSFAADMRAQQKKDLLAVYAALDKIDSQRASDFVALKKELDTLAVNADAELRTTERHVLALANFTQPLALPQP